MLKFNENIIRIKFGEKMSQVEKIIERIKEKVVVKPHTTAVVLGRGYDDFLEKIEDCKTISFDEIPELNAIGKDKNNLFAFGKIGGKDVVVVIGRLHYNLGYNPEDIATFIYVLKALGCSEVILTSSVGSLNPKIKVGDIVTATDHINLTGRNPLYKNSYNKFGNCFIDMTDCYDRQMIDSFSLVAKTKLGIKIKKGVLVEFAGPSAETPSESKFAKQIGGDFTGFNIVCETIACKYCSLPVIIIALVTNYASCLSRGEIKHEDIVYNRKCASSYFYELVYNLAQRV